jgi:hypothetical protein
MQESMTVHISDQNHPQNAELTKQFERCHPDIVIVCMILSGLPKTNETKIVGRWRRNTKYLHNTAIIQIRMIIEAVNQSMIIWSARNSIDGSTNKYSRGGAVV